MWQEVFNIDQIKILICLKYYPDIHSLFIKQWLNYFDFVIAESQAIAEGLKLVRKVKVCYYCDWRSDAITSAKCFSLISLQQMKTVISEGEEVLQHGLQEDYWYRVAYQAKTDPLASECPEQGGDKADHQCPDQWEAQDYAVSDICLRASQERAASAFTLWYRAQPEPAEDTAIEGVQGQDRSTFRPDDWDGVDIYATLQTRAFHFWRADPGGTIQSGQSWEDVKECLCKGADR